MAFLGLLITDFIVIYIMASDNSVKIRRGKPIHHEQKLVFLFVAWLCISFVMHNWQYYPSVLYLFGLLWSVHYLLFDLILNIFREDKKWYYIGKSFWLDRPFASLNKNFMWGFLVQSIIKLSSVAVFTYLLYKYYPSQHMPWN
jgi:hypothetical protein